MVISFNWRWGEEGLHFPWRREGCNHGVDLMKSSRPGQRSAEICILHSAISSAIFCKHFHLNLCESASAEHG